MITTRHTNAEDITFHSLVGELDAELKLRDGDEHFFYAQFNKIDKIKHVVLAYEHGVPVGCGAVKEYSQDTMEIKRMYVRFGSRGKGIASIILMELENWCREMEIKKCILETGVKQPDAIRLYEKNDYKRIANFGQYENAENSVCFEKYLEPRHLGDV